MISLFLYALFLTVFIETFTLFIFRKFNYFGLKKIRASKIIFVGISASMMTLPYLWLAFFTILGDNYSFLDYVLFTFFGETTVFVVEGIFYYFVFDMKLKNAILLSFLVNFISWAIGLFILS